MLARHIGMLVDKGDVRRPNVDFQRCADNVFGVLYQLRYIQPWGRRRAGQQIGARFVKHRAHRFRTSFEAVNMHAAELNQPLHNQFFTAVGQPHPEGLPIFMSGIKLPAVEQIGPGHESQPQMWEAFAVACPGSNPVLTIKAGLIVAPKGNEFGHRQGAANPVENEARRVRRNLSQPGIGFGLGQALGFEARLKMGRWGFVYDEARATVKPRRELNGLPIQPVQGVQRWKGKGQ